MVTIIPLCFLFLVGELQLRTEGHSTNVKVVLSERNQAENTKFFAKTHTPQEPIWEAPVKKSTTASSPERADFGPSVGNRKQENKKGVGTRCMGEDLPSLGPAQDSRTNPKISPKVKRSFEFDNIQDGTNSASYNSMNDEESEEIWNPTFTGKKQDERAILKSLLHQGTPPAFGTAQEAREEQNTINEIENLSRQSSVIPKNLHLPYMNGPTDNVGFDFSKMDISVGRSQSDFDNNGKNSEATFLRRHFIPLKGHKWETRNRDRIPRHRIPDFSDKTHDKDSSLNNQIYEYYPMARLPSYARLYKRQPSSLEPFHRLERFPPLDPMILSDEEKGFREPIPPREPEPEPEPEPISEYIPQKEPASIPEIPSLREIPPIPEPTQPTPEDVNPKDTFGS